MNAQDLIILHVRKNKCDGGGDSVGGNKQEKYLSTKYDDPKKHTTNQCKLTKLWRLSNGINLQNNVFKLSTVRCNQTGNHGRKSKLNTGESNSKTKQNHGRLKPPNAKKILVATEYKND